MRRSLLILVAATALAGVALAQSLAEVARETRKAKAQSQASKVYDNDNLPTSSPITIAATSVPETQAKSDAKDKSGQDSPEEKKKRESEFRVRIAEQKKTIAQLEREIDVAQREWRMRGAVFYSDAGTQLRDPRKFMDEQRKSQGELEAKQRDLSAAKEKLEGIREEARKAGVPSVVWE